MTFTLFFLFFVKDYIYPGVEVVSLGFIKRTCVLGMGWGRPETQMRPGLVQKTRAPEGCRTAYTRHLPPQKSRSHGCGFFQRLSGHPCESWSFLGWIREPQLLPSQPGQGPSASQPAGRMRGPWFLFGLRAPLPPGPGVRRGGYLVTVEVPTELPGFSPRLQQSPHKLSLSLTVQWSSLAFNRTRGAWVIPLEW